MPGSSSTRSGRSHSRPCLRWTPVFCSLLILAPIQTEAAARAFWYSLLIPGWGQRHLGQHRSAARFAVAEAGLWASYFGLRHVADIRGDTYRTHAAARAGAAPSHKDRQYFDDLGFYASRSDHNRLALVSDGADAELYPTSAQFFWEWDSEGSRQRYRELRNSAQTADRQAVFATGLLLANHLIAAIHAARGGSQLRRNEDGGDEETVRLRSTTVEVGAGPNPRALGIFLTTRW